MYRAWNYHSQRTQVNVEDDVPFTVYTHMGYVNSCKEMLPRLKCDVKQMSCSFVRMLDITSQGFFLKKHSDVEHYKWLLHRVSFHPLPSWAPNIR